MAKETPKTRERNSDGEVSCLPLPPDLPMGQLLARSPHDLEPVAGRHCSSVPAVLDGSRAGQLIPSRARTHERVGVSSLPAHCSRALAPTSSRRKRQFP